MWRGLAVCLLLMAGAARGQTLCEGNEYERALCAYRGAKFSEAAALFHKVAEAGADDPVTIKSRYFLARTFMKQKKWDAAAAELTRIYSLSKPFYDEWNCDFLLGECRRMLGKG
jgi:TolA-binding protein